MIDLIDSILSMDLDLYVQSETQDANTGAIKKEWMFSKTIPCHAKGIVSNSATARSGDKQVFGAKYINDQTIQIRTIEKLNVRQKITNIRDSSGNVIWTEIDYPQETPTVFEVVGVTPITDPFGGTLGFNSTLKRSENQTIGI
jgi:hypothetical protein